MTYQVTVKVKYDEYIRGNLAFTEIIGWADQTFGPGRRIPKLSNAVWRPDDGFLYLKIYKLSKLSIDWDIEIVLICKHQWQKTAVMLQWAELCWAT